MAMIQAQTQTQWNDKVVEYISYDVSYYQLNWYIKIDIECNNLCDLDIETYVLSTSVIHNNNNIVIQLQTVTPQADHILDELNTLLETVTKNDCLVILYIDAWVECTKFLDYQTPGFLLMYEFTRCTLKTITQVRHNPLLYCIKELNSL